MSLLGQCHICGKPTTRSCRMCGRLVCDDCSDRASGLCQNCSTGRKGTGRGKGRPTDDQFMKKG